MKEPKTLMIKLAEGELKKNFLPFIKNGALFIKTSEKFDLGDILNLKLQLSDTDATIVIETRVILTNPHSSNDRYSGGIGLQFITDNQPQALQEILHNTKS